MLINVCDLFMQIEMESESNDRKEIKLEVLSLDYYLEKVEELDEEVQVIENI